MIKSGPRAMERIRDIFVRRQGQIRKNMERLERLHTEIEASLRYLEQCGSCPAASAARCQTCTLERAPGLLAEFHRPPTGEHVAVGPLLDSAD